MCASRHRLHLVKHDPIDLVEQPFRQVQSSSGRLSERLPITANMVVRLLNWGDVAGRAVIQNDLASGS